ncbi:ABC transporter ATP-binding protein [Chloroflexota bacterium]
MSKGKYTGNGKLIELKNITKLYSLGMVDVKAVDDLSLSIAEGEFVAIIGASGSGKSTVMNIMGCLDKPTSGDYYFDGENINHLNDNRLAELRSRKFGFVFQDFNLLARSTALANVELPLIYLGTRNRRARAFEALERVGLGARAGHKPTELSGGEQQRVAIARALVNCPSLIFADEPTGNLDSKSTAEIMNVLSTLNKEGITVLIITHEMDMAEQTRRIVKLTDGKIVSDESVSKHP